MKSIFLLLTSAMMACATHPLLIAHRGASHAAPENTLSAFKLAWEENADGIEGDFLLTADGEVVCIHDATTKRTAGIKRTVAKTTWPELAKLDVGSWKNPRYKGEPIPRLGDVLDILPPDKWFFLEIKAGKEIVAPIQRILLDKDADPKRVVLISFDPEVVRECRRVMPEYQAHWVSSLKDIHRGKNSDLYLKALQETGAQGLQFNANAPVTADWLGEVKQKNHLLTSWTVDDVAIARKMIGFGVHHITTNRPAGLRAELAR